MHYLLSYVVDPDYVARRETHRAEHLRLAWEAAARGELLLGGALGEPVEEALLLFTGDSPAAAEAFARRDPYVAHGVVRSWRVRPWRTVVGDGAAQPVRPA